MEAPRSCFVTYVGGCEDTLEVPQCFLFIVRSISLSPVVIEVLLPLRIPEYQSHVPWWRILTSAPLSSASVRQHHGEIFLE